MGVDVESNGNSGMAQPIRDNLGMNTGFQSQSGMSMAEVMQMYRRESALLDGPSEGFAHPLGME